MQCNILCNNDANCYGHKWEETNGSYLCTLIEKDGLCSDRDNQNHVKLFVEEANICSTQCQGGVLPSANYNDLLFLEKKHL